MVHLYTSNDNFILCGSSDDLGKTGSISEYVFLVRHKWRIFSLGILLKWTSLLGSGVLVVLAALVAD